MRSIPNSLFEALTTGTRQPAFKVYAWKESSYTQVITGTATETPADLTPYLTEIRWQLTQLECSFSDPDGDLHPDYGELRSYLANGVIVRLREGDHRVDESFWIWTFTGKIKGQYGYSYSRANQAFTGRFQAYGREAEQAFKRRKITTQEYTVGTDLGIALHDILSMLGITVPERRIPQILNQPFYHKTNQISQLSPWEAIETLLYPALLVPYFDGEGRISAYRKSLLRKPDLVLEDYVRVHRIEAPNKTDEPINKVVVKYLDANLTEVEGPHQKLGQASITTGFFTSKEEILCYWSEDRKQRARNTTMKIIKSVNDNLLPVGSESYQEIDAYHGKITITISAWVPTLAGAMLATYLAGASIPDNTESTATNKTPIVLSAPGEINLVAPGGTGGPVSGSITIPSSKISTTEDVGWTIPWGRIVQATSLVGILTIMMSLGSAQYEIWGTPYDLVYLEKEFVAIEEGTEYWQENELKIENDFIGVAERAEACAVNELHYAKSSFEARTIVIDDLPSLEPGDIISLPKVGDYFITGLSKVITPGGAVPQLEISGFRVLGMEIES